MNVEIDNKRNFVIYWYEFELNNLSQEMHNVSVFTSIWLKSSSLIIYILDYDTTMFEVNEFYCKFMKK